MKGEREREIKMNIDNLIEILPLIVSSIGGIICIVFVLLADKVFYLKVKTMSTISVVLMVLTLTGCIGAKEYRNNYYLEKADSYYTEIKSLIQKGYVVYMNGVTIDFDKIFVSDYSSSNIHRNDELKEIYISTN